MSMSTMLSLISGIRFRFSFFLFQLSIQPVFIAINFRLRTNLKSHQDPRFLTFLPEKQLDIIIISITVWEGSLFLETLDFSLVSVHVSPSWIGTHSLVAWVQKSGGAKSIISGQGVKNHLGGSSSQLACFNFTSHQIIYFTSCCRKFTKFWKKEDFKPIR